MARDIIIPSLSNLEDIIGINPNNLPGVSSSVSAEDTTPEAKQSEESNLPEHRQGHTYSQPNRQEKTSREKTNKAAAKYRERSVADKPTSQEKSPGKATAKVGEELINLSSDKDWLSFLKEAENVRGHAVRLVRVSLTPETISALVALRIAGVPTNRALAAAFQTFINSHKNELNQLRQKLMT